MSTVARADTRGPSKVVPDHGPLAFEVQYVYRPGGQGELQALKDGSVLNSGDHYKIQFVPQDEAYVHIFQIDSSNAVFPLFPMQAFGGVVVNNHNPVRAGVTYVIPAADKSFQLDQQTGQEVIFFFASRVPNPTLDEIAQQLNEGLHRGDAKMIQAAGAKLADTVKTRGPAKIVEDPKQNSTLLWNEKEKFTMPQRLEQLCAYCVSKVTFEHR